MYIKTLFDCLLCDIGLYVTLMQILGVTELFTQQLPYCTASRTIFSRISLNLEISKQFEIKLLALGDNCHLFAVHLYICTLYIYTFVHKVNLNEYYTVAVTLDVCGQREVLRAMKTRKGSTGVALSSVNLDVSLGWVVSFTPRPLYHRVRAPVAIV